MQFRSAKKGKLEISQRKREKAKNKKPLNKSWRQLKEINSISMRPIENQGVRLTSVPYNHSSRQNLHQSQSRRRQNVNDQLVNLQLQENSSGWNRKQAQDDPQLAMQQIMQAEDRECCPTLTCYNCREEAHLARNCDRPPKRICYSCSSPNVTIKRCPDCNPNSMSQRNAVDR